MTKITNSNSKYYKSFYNSRQNRQLLSANHDVLSMTSGWHMGLPVMGPASGDFGPQRYYYVNKDQEKLQFMRFSNDAPDSPKNSKILDAN